MAKIIVFITVPSAAEASRISNVLLKSRLAACVSTLKGVDSAYWWKGKIEKSKELLLTVKSDSRLLAKIIRTVKQNHSYDVPEIVAVTIAGGNEDYLKWIIDSINI